MKKFAAVVLAVCMLSAGSRAETENAAGSAAGETAVESGAASLDELKEILSSGFLFTVDHSFPSHGMDLIQL